MTILIKFREKKFFAKSIVEAANFVSKNCGVYATQADIVHMLKYGSTHYGLVVKELTPGKYKMPAAEDLAAVMVKS